MLSLRSARGRALLAGVVLVLLLCGVAAIGLWRAQSDRAARRSLEQRSDVVAAVEDGRARFFEAAALMAIADAYSAMSLDRPYRKALSVDEIMAEIKAGAGTRFDPHLVEVFVEMLQAERRAQAA